MRKANMHMTEQSTRVSYASTETLHGVDSNTNQNTNADPHSLPAAPDATNHIIICE